MTDARKIEIIENIQAYIKNENPMPCFICNIIKYGIGLGHSEYFGFLQWFHTNKPDHEKFTSFTEHERWTGGYSWWVTGEKEERLRFLEELKKHIGNERIRR